MVKVEKKTQVLTISPQNEVIFKGDPSETNTSKIHIFNPLPQKVAFKILTNVPHILFVRPTFDVITPEGSCTVNVMSQPSTETAVDSFKTHKLLIQSIILPDNIDLPVDKLISTKANTSDVMETKLSCTFQVSYTSELAFPLESEEEKPVAQEVEKKPKTSSSLGYFAIFVAIVACIIAFLFYHFNFLTEEAAIETDDVTEDMIKELEEKILALEND